MRLQAIADRSIVRLTDAKGNTLGTGFVIAAGVVMTCHHVVANLVRVWYLSLIHI